MSDVTYPFPEVPNGGEMTEVASGVFWIRMPLPFKLNHINLWLLKDEDGWTIVDTGINTDDVRTHWQTLFDGPLKNSPIKKIIVTHFHPDHVGLAGWLCDKFGLELHMTLGEWGMARNLKLETSEQNHTYLSQFYKRAGFGPDLMALIKERSVSYPSRICVPPAGIKRIKSGQVLTIDGARWEIMIGTGHSPEHACLYCAEKNVLISGDQILPRISPNISIWPQEPTADPLAEFLDSLKLFGHLPEDTLVLPSHDKPFLGLRNRLNDLAHHHEERLEECFSACATPSTGLEVLKQIFTRELDSHQVFFAIGETLAHIHHLEQQGRLQRNCNTDGVFLFSQTA